MIGAKANNYPVIKWIRRAALILAALFILFSLTPYLIPLNGLEGDRYEQVYANSFFETFDDLELHYRIWGDGETGSGNIFMLHGLGASTFSWRYAVPYFEAKGYRVLAADLPGFGLSERRAGIDHSALARAEIMWSLLDHIAPREQWHLVGHSMGGATVTAMAMLEPEKSASLILVAGAVSHFEPSVISFLLKYPPMARWFKYLGSKVLVREDRVEQFLLSAYGRSPEYEEVLGYYLPLTIEGTETTYLDMIDSAAAPLPGNISDLQLPVLLLWGEEDSWVSIEHGLHLERKIGHSRLVRFAGEGHSPMETAPELFNQTLENFLSGLD